MSLKVNERIEFAHILRGWAAIAVLIWHYYGLFWIKRDVAADLANIPLLPESWSTPLVFKWIHSINTFNWGAYGVAVFFLISGFVMPFALQRQNRLEFVINRIMRIIPVYVVGFSITISALWVASCYFNRVFPYLLNEVLIHFIPGIRDILGGVSIDGIVWTLEIELKFYIICALFLGTFARSSLKVFIIPFALATLAFPCLFLLDMLVKIHPLFARLTYVFCFNAQFIVFLYIGVVANYWYRHLLTNRNALLLATCLFLIFILLWGANPYELFFERWPSYLLALLTFFVASKLPKVLLNNRILNFFANISYPLYACHGVAGYVMLSIFLDNGYSPFLSLFLVTFSALAVSWLIHISVEVMSIKIGKNVIHRLKTRKSQLYK